MSNGALLLAAEELFDVLITTDQGMRYQQNRGGKNLRIVVLMTASWRRIEPMVPQIKRAVENAEPGELIEVSVE